MEKKKILVTGGTGFLGREVAEALRHAGHAVSPVGSKRADLLNEQEAGDLIRSESPDVVVHLAAVCGGIGANQSLPATYFSSNLKMGMNVIESSRLAGVGSIVMCGTVCSYPRDCPAPFKEDDLWSGYPEVTNAPYGVAKKALFEMLTAYRRQYGTKSVCLLPVNLYGPGDNFRLRSSHVIPALIRRFAEAVEQRLGDVTVWGTGSATREFLHVRDAANAFVAAVEQEDHDEPINLGGGGEISIGSLAEMIADAVGFRGKILWDVTKPDGQPRRSLDSSRAEEILGWRPLVPFGEGLEETVEWWLEQKRPS
jgi:GDP-L-fucose synthase